MDVKLDADEYTREEIDSKIARGLAQLEDGQGINGEEFLERLQRRGERVFDRRADDVTSALAHLHRNQR